MPPTDNASPSAAVASEDLWIDSPQGRLFARRWHPADTAPARSPIVMLHDSLGCVALWRDFPAVLAAATGRSVVAYDRAGFGQSAAQAELPPVDFVAQESTGAFAALRAQLGIGRFVGLGHSVGGGMAVCCAADHAEDCQALVTIAAQTFAEDRTLEGIRAAKLQFQDPEQVARLARYHGDKTRWVLDAWIENWLDPRFGQWQLAPVLPRVKCPVLAIHGEHDEYGSSVHPLQIARLSGGGGRAEILPQAGHVPHREDPARIAGLIAGFLAPVA